MDTSGGGLMRIRSTKPEFWRSDLIAAVSWDARLVLKALESYVDDNGVGKDDLELIVGDLFMRDLVREPSRTLARVSEAISELNRNGLVWRYADEGTSLLYLSFWESVQRIDKPLAGRLRRPDGTLDYKSSMIRGSVATPREASRSLAPGTGEQGNRGTGEQSLSRDADAPLDTDDLFNDFWDTYGKKVDRKKAEQKWRLALKKPEVTADILIVAARSYVAWERANNEGGKFVMDPTRWLAGERWTDERTSCQQSPVNVRRLPHASEIATPPNGLSDEEYAAWWAHQQAGGDR